MKKLSDLPVLLVHYPTGSGGWFLASLLHYAVDQTIQIKFDSTGSGHANQSIKLINNWYDHIIPTAIGQAIIHDSQYDIYTQQQRIEFLKDSLFATELFDKNILHVLSLHCVNINIFMQALPLSKCIQININQDDLLKCTGLFLKKKLAFQQFSNFADHFNVARSQHLALFNKLQHIQMYEDLYSFDWAVPYIQSLLKNVANDANFSDRFFEIMFTDLMTADADQFMQSILQFLDLNVSPEVYNNLIEYLETYRNQQPLFATLR
jgi:hypothetical protein